MTKLKVKESDILRTILNYLAVTKQFHWRQNTGAFQRADGHFYRFGNLGSPDIFIVKKGQIYGAEVKAEKRVQSDNQKEWERKFTKAGGKYLLARSLEEFIKLYER